MPGMSYGRALAVVVLGLLASAFAVDQDAKGRVTINNVCRVYHPSAPKTCQTTYKKIGVVTSRKVFEATPEYKQIAKRRLTPNTAEWCFLAKAASDKFRAAVDKTVKGGGYDLIAENGAITVEGQTAFDVTSEILAHLPAE
jgi:hypothetical protein